MFLPQAVVGSAQGLILTLLLLINPGSNSAESIRLAKSTQGRSDRAQQPAKPPITIISASATNIQTHTSILMLGLNPFVQWDET